MTSLFDQDTSVSTTDGSAYGTHLTNRWSIGAVPNGGYSSAPAIRSMLEATERDVPLSVTTHFYKPTVPDADATIATEVHRRGRTAAYASASLAQDGVERSRLTGVFGTLPEAGTPGQIMPAPFELPAPDDCVARDPAVQGARMTLLDNVEVRLEPAALELADGSRADRPISFGGWVRFVDERPPDALALTLFADAFPPPILMVEPSAGWVPTIELTVHVRRRPVDGWIRAECSTVDLQDNLLVEEIRLWDASDALVAQGRQLAMLLTR
jgi:acyl-coenzyme A thioesterase PaaI-like protein